MSPDFLPPATCDFPTREREIAFVEGFSLKCRFPFLVWKNDISRGVENRGSLISVSLALREGVFWKRDSFKNVHSLEIVAKPKEKDDEAMKWSAASQLEGVHVTMEQVFGNSRVWGEQFFSGVFLR